MAGHQHESINVQDTGSSFAVFHQNIMGRLKKSELTSSFSPDFAQVLCLTEHHLKHFEFILYIYIWININLALNFAGNLSRVVELVFLCMMRFSIRILKRNTEMYSYISLSLHYSIISSGHQSNLKLWMFRNRWLHSRCYCYI